MEVRKTPWPCPYGGYSRHSNARLFCLQCPDAARIPAECEDWDCLHCARLCPCLIPPAEGSERAACWRSYLQRADQECKSRPVYRPHDKVPCPVCGKPMGAKRSRMCGRCSRIASGLLHQYGSGNAARRIEAGDKEFAETLRNASLES